MRNPWTKKNPFMSMWLSGANKVMGSARGQATAAIKREASAGTSQMIDLWANALKLPGTKIKTKRKR